MQIRKFLSKSRIVDITATDLREALQQLLDTVPDKLLEKNSKKDVLDALIEREKAISTYLDNGICMPNARLKGLKRKYILAAGRCPKGLSFGTNEEYKNTRILFLILSDESAGNFLTVLSSLTKVLSLDENVDKLIASADINAFRADIFAAFGKTQPQKDGKAKNAASQHVSKRSPEGRLNSLIAKSAARAAKASKCAAILVQADTFTALPNLSEYFGDMKVVLMTDNPQETLPANWSAVYTRSFSDARLSQLRSAIMVAVTRGMLSAKDRICCIGGIKDSNLLDSFVIIDIGKEFSNILIGQNDMLPEGVKPEVLERVLDIATELAVEGREGKPVGCLFVIGKVEELRPHLKQLILNPFYGYKPEDRNVLNPFMDETVKEYSLIDGAFIINSDGILEAAGALIHTPDFKLQLPGGLGSRHAAAYSISLMADCISMAVSSSTGQITLFRRGQMMPINEKRKK